ncbi:hypothetical protein [Thiobaca trueperi]|uniref:Uncharacterized protein n=1 Tax=Thiobaca trueperi TaxID=127458 RepID=A0A4R3N321_9GAMM|nr:hypothetical protein [Thiobaca trueperi]TCT21463.1 hypothetical protein EDC35_104321 [Thiobaca trueperi]
MDQTQRCKWVNKQRESEWLQKATFDLDLDPFEARSLILGASSARLVFVETEVERLLDDLVVSFADPRGRLTRDSFRQLAAAVQTMARGVVDKKVAEQAVKDAAARKGLKPQGSGLLRSKRWFRAAGITDARTDT